MEKKRSIVYFLVLAIIIAVIIAIFMYPKSKENDSTNLPSTDDSHSKSYLDTLNKLEIGNEYVINNNLSDGCFPYRTFHRGCYYDLSKNYLVAPNLQEDYYNLTNEEIIEMCYKFAHKGAVAYCLKSNNELSKCTDFAGDNQYLMKICSLKDGELIYSAFSDGLDTCNSKGCTEFKFYSDFN
jgi:hypothetical protein